MVSVDFGQRSYFRQSVGMLAGCLLCWMSRKHLPLHERTLTCFTGPTWSERVLPQCEDFDCIERHPDLLEHKDGPVKPSAVAQAACHLELLDCFCFGCRGADHLALADTSFARCSRVTLSLRGHIECVVRWSLAGTARDGSLGSRLLLLLPPSNLFVECKGRRNTTLRHFHGVSVICRVADRCPKRRHGIASARPR